MADVSVPIPVASVGFDALHVLRRGARGAVAAVFTRSLYARFGRDWICFGDLSIGNAPLNALVPSREFARWHDRVVLGDAIEVAGGTTGSVGVWRVRPHGANVWRLPAAGPTSLRQVSRKLAELPERLPAGIPDDGLACFIRQPAAPRSLVARRAAPCVRTIGGWIAAPGRPAAHGLTEALGGLIGLGPGLTPSGDDFLAGVLAALRGLGRREQAGALWGLTEPLALERTHPISVSHLRAAAQGGLCESLHGVLRALLGSRDWPALDCWPDLGHSSPWDALAGVATALRASVPVPGSDNAHDD